MGQETAEVVVVGGGIRGVAITYGLARAGVNVVLLEKRFIASAASGLNMGYVNVSAKGPEHYTILSKLSADIYPELNEELGGGFEYEKNGALDVAETDADFDYLSRTVEERNRVPGIDMKMLGPKETRSLEPAITPDIRGSRWCPIDGVVHPLKLVRALLKAAVRKGAIVHCGEEVRDIRVCSGRIESVVTTNLEISTHVVVDTAGIHAAEIARMVKVNLPVFPERGQIIITEPLPRILNRAVGPFKQYGDGQVLIGASNEDVGENTAVTPEILSKLAREAIRILPVLKRAQVIRCTAGLRPMTPDRHPVYQKVSEVSDFYIAVGHSGFTLAPVTAKIFTDLILQGETNVALDAYRHERFA